MSKVRLVALERRVEEDFDAMRPWLPETATDVLDIGCGSYPLIDMWIARHYGSGIAVHLMDGSDIIPGGKGAGFSYQKKPYNSRFLGLDFLQTRLPETRLYEHLADPSSTIPSDIIVSRRAWGHHFSIQTYIQLAKRSLRAGGRIITDIRNRTDGLSIFRRHGFRTIVDNIEVRSTKCRRVVLSR